MDTKVLYLFIIVLIAGLGFYGYSQSGGNLKNQINPLVQQYVPSSIKQQFSTGDIMTLNLQPLNNVNTVSSSSDPNVIITKNNPNSTNVIKTNFTANIDNTTRLTTAVGQTYGYTSNNKEVLPTDTYQLGVPVGISGMLQMVIPNSCTNFNGQVTCQYVQPPIWKFLVTISCKIDQNNNCAMDDYNHWGQTDGSGNYNMTWETSSGSMNPGPYLVSIQASSLVKDSHGLQYTINQQKLVNLVP